MDTENTPQVASSLDIAAQNSMALPIIMRDINVMKQGILKLVKIAGGTQRDKADRFFLSSSEREKSYESQMLSKRSTTPTKVGEKKDGKGFFGQANDFLNSIIAGGLTNMLIKGGLIAGILYGIGKFFTSAEFRASVSNMIGNFGRTVFGEEGWKDVKKNIALGAGLLLAGIVAVKAALIYLSESIAASAWGMGGRRGRGRRAGGGRAGSLLGLATIAAGSTFAASRMLDSSEGGDSSNVNQEMSTMDKVSVGLGVATAGGLAASGVSSAMRATKGTKVAIGLAQSMAGVWDIPNFPLARPNSKWGKFLKFVEKKSPKLWKKIGLKLAQAGALAAIPIGGWIMAAVKLGFAFWTAWELYELWKEFTNQSDGASDNSPEKSTESRNEEQEKSSLISRLMNDSGGIRIDANVTPDYYNMMGVNPPTSSPSSVSSPSMRSTYSGGGDDVDRVLNSIKGVESGGGDYNAKNPNSTASGAYQFIDSTWRASTKKYGIGQQYPTARSAPPEIQDAVARKSVEELMAKYNGDTDKVANVWYTGNPNGNMTAAGLAANRGFTSEKYRAKFQSFQNNSGGSLNQSSNAMLNSRNAGSSSPIVFAPNTTNNNVGGNNGGTLSLPSSGVTDTEFSKLLVERAIG
jgi:hypothetical protein